MARTSTSAFDLLPPPPPRKGPLPLRNLEAVQLSVLCINCEEMVDVAYVEQHSQICTRISEEVRKAERSEDPLNPVHLRTTKLRLFLQHLAEDSRSGERNYLMIMMRLLQQLANTPTDESTQEVLKSLSSLIATFTGADSMLLFLERVRSLALEQANALNLLELQRKKNEIEDLRGQVQVQKQKVQIWQRTLLKARESAPPPQIDVLKSEAVSLKSGSDSTFSLAVEDEAAGQLFAMPREDQLRDSEELKRAFFSQCLAVKMSMKPKDRAQIVSIPPLFEKAMTQKVPVEEWPEFIRKELSSPENWGEKKATPKRFSARAVNTRFSYFETIPEEGHEPQ